MMRVIVAVVLALAVVQGCGGGSSGGPGGGAGADGAAGQGDTCAAGVTNGAGGIGCPQGTSAVGSVVHATGFGAYESRAVRAAFTQSVGAGPTISRTTRVSQGAFDVDVLFANDGCNLGATSFAGGALYIDANGDGRCDPAVDFLFVWVATGGPPGTCNPVDLTPTSEHCSLGSYRNDLALAAAQAVCPAVGSCLGICGAGNTGAGGSSPGLCADGGAGD
jgi:hypothetical protein